MITYQTRRASYDRIKPRINARAMAILKILSDGQALTAREIMYELGYTDPNKVRPRLTELTGANLVKVIDKRYDIESGVKVAVYKAVVL